MHFSFEGPIGVGKTTLAKLFAAHLPNAVLALEDFEGNKFLNDFYSDRAQWGLPMQLWFLIDRHTQFGSIEMSSERPTVSDHSLLKDKAFAKALLSGRELELYERTAAALGTAVREPDVIVLLNASNDVLMQRISYRARPYEDGITPFYLDQLRHTYAEVLDGVKSKVIKVDTSTLDLSSQTQLNKIFNLIRG